MTLTEFLNQTLGASELGTNESDKGECLGYISLYFQKVLGLTYPIYGAQFAYQMLTARNDHPEILTQVQGTNGIKRGDVWVMDKSVSLPYGHIGIAVSDPYNGLIDVVEQNWTYHKVTNRQLPLNQIKGYIKIGGMMSAEFDTLKKLIEGVNAKVDDNFIALQNEYKQLNQVAVDTANQALKVAQTAPTQELGLSTEDKASVSWVTKLRQLLGIKE